MQGFWNREDLFAVGRQRIVSFYGNYESRESSRGLSSRTDRLGFGIGADQSGVRQLSPGNSEDCIRYRAQLDRLLLSGRCGMGQIRAIHQDSRCNRRDMSILLSGR